jgi:ribosome-associated heat shock protein Hsp15
MHEPPTDASVRLDLWLWAARFFRTRSLARQAVEAGKVRVAGARAKPSRPVRTGDVLEVERAGEAYLVTVLGVSGARGPAPVARSLYEEDDGARRAREAQRAERAAARAGYRPPEGRPDKRARRLIRALGDIDAT